MKMLYPSINDIRKNKESRYTLVILTAMRAREIIDGKPVLVDSYKNVKKQSVSIAAKEIAEDYIAYKASSEN